VRRSERGLHLSGCELDALVKGISGFDLRRIPVQKFPPAERIIAALGHLVRFYREPRAWVVEAAFRMDLPPIVIRGPLATMDGIEQLVELELPVVPAVPADGINFLYRGFGSDVFDIPEIEALPGRVHLSAEEISTILASDAAEENSWAAHLVHSASAWAEMIDQHVETRAFVASDPPRVEVFGLSYVLEDHPALRNLRSSLELGFAASERGVPLEIATAAAELSLRVGRNIMVAWIDRRIADGWVVLPNFGAGGVIYDVCALSPDGRWAVGAHRTDGSWVRSPVLALGPHGLGFAHTLSETHLSSGESIP